MIELSVDKFTKISLEKCPHILVGGSTGSGKSHTVAKIIQNAINCKESKYKGLNNSHIIIFIIISYLFFRSELWKIRS